MLEFGGLPATTLANQYGSPLYVYEAARIRELCPDMLILMPGVGAQEGELEAAVRASVDASGGGVIVSASRAVIYAGEGGDREGYAPAAREAATALRDSVNAARGSGR